MNQPPITLASLGGGSRKVSGGNHPRNAHDHQCHSGVVLRNQAQSLKVGGEGGKRTPKTAEPGNIGKKE